MKEIVDLLLRSVTERLKEQDIELEITEEAKDKLTEIGYDPDYGARPLRRAIQKHIEDLLSEELLKGNIKSGQQVMIDVSDGRFVIKTNIYSV